MWGYELNHPVELMIPVESRSAGKTGTSDAVPQFIVSHKLVDSGDHARQRGLDEQAVCSVFKQPQIRLVDVRDGHSPRRHIFERLIRRVLGEHEDEPDV